MSRWPKRESWLRWLFLLPGGLLFFANRFVFEFVLRVYYWAEFFFPFNLTRQHRFVAGAAIAQVTCVVLCLLTAWGLKRDRRWSRWTGIGGSCLLLLGVPWLTPLGVAGLYALIRHPIASKDPVPRQDFWDPNRQSLLLVIASIVGLIVTLQGLLMFERHAQRIGLPDTDPGSRLLIVLIALRLLYLPVHELGHGWAAWAVGFHVQQIAIGPMVFTQGPLGWRAKFQWKRLVQAAGYVGAAPMSDRLIRLKQIVVAAAGPVTSLAVGLLLTLAFFHLPGTPWEHLWPFVAIASLVGFYDFALNLVPLGYTDGTMLLHLILGTRRGDELLARILGSQIPGTCDGSEDGLEVKRQALEVALQTRPQNTAALAIAHSTLGLEELAAGRMVEAEANLRRALEFANGAANLSIDSWIGLHRIYLVRQRADEAHHAYLVVRDLCETLRRQVSSVDQRLQLSGILAELDVSAGAFEPALAEIAAALPDSPRQRKRLFHGTLLRLRATCEFQLGHPGPAVAAADEAAGIFRTRYIRSSDRVPALRGLGLLGMTCVQAGRMEKASAFLTECIRLLETHGARNEAARWRLILAEVLRKRGLLGEAMCALPVAGRMPHRMRKDLLQERGTILLRAGRLAYALADCEELLRLTLADTPADEIAVATAENSLADACLESGDVDRAESLARGAYRRFTAAGHPNAAWAGVTLALVAWRRNLPAGLYLQETLRTISEAPLQLPAHKAGWLEEEADRLEKGGLLQEAEEFRATAARFRHVLGIDCPRASAALAATAASRS